MKREYWLGLGLLVLYLVLAAAATQILHFSRALDEGYHLEYITFIKQNGRLPVTYEERAQITRADYPPLYHLLVATLVRGVDVTNGPTFKYFSDSFRYQVVDHQTTHPLFFFTEDMTSPYLGQFLVWQIGRWFSLFLSLLALVVIFVTLWRIPAGQKPLVPLAGAALLAFNPRFLIVMSSLNDDSLLVLVAALYFWALVETVKNPGKWRNYLFLGVLVGVSVTVKYSMVIAPLEVLLILSVLAWQRRLGWFWAVQRLVVVALLAILFSSWWFGWNVWHLNTVTEDGWFVGITRSLFAGGYDVTLNRIGGTFSGGEVGATELPKNRDVGTLGQWVQVTFSTMWGYSVGDKIPAFPIAYFGLALFLLAAGIGLYRLWHRAPPTRQWILLALFHICIFLIIPLLRFSLTRRIGETAQGRHIFIPAAAAIVALLAWGITEITPRHWRGRVFGVIIAAFIGWTGLHLVQLHATATPLLPLRTVAQAAEWLPNSVNAQFGDKGEIELVSYRLDPRPAQGQLGVELAWRSRERVNENYRLRVTLLDQTGTPVSVWLGYTGDGRLPTLAWDPGDVVFDRLRLPLSNVPAGSYAVQVQLIQQNGQPLPVAQNGAEQTTLTLAEISLAESSALNFGDAGVTVWPSGTTLVRYPGTLVVVSGEPSAAVELVDPTGTVWSPDTAANGVNNFVVGPRWPSGEYGISLNGQKTGVTVTVENWWPRRFAPPDNIETPLRANFAEQVHLLGYSLPQKQARAGEAFPVTLVWQASADKSPQANFIQFNNLLDSSGTLHGGYDRLPLENYSTLLWAPGEVVVDGYAVPVDADAPPGEYWLDVGLYLTVGEAAVNLPLVVDGQRTDVTSVRIGPVEVLK